MYSLLKYILFKLNPETAHQLSLILLSIAHRLGLTHFFKTPINNPIMLMGISFPNKIGLAAGLDKNADYLSALASLGFGFIEVGTITPKPQAGNPKPRLFRLIKEKALINRMGFNNKGMDYVANRLEKTNYQGILGINIGKNKDTPPEKAVDDYIACFRKLWKYASYVTINISSPNTPGLRDLHQIDALTTLLSTLKKEQLAVASQKYVPLVVKISPDLSEEALADTAAVLLEQKIDGVIATNTTLDKSAVSGSVFASEAGGLSGAPLKTSSTKVVEKLNHLLKGSIPIIASGGIMDNQAIEEKYQAGASLVQVYTGLIYNGSFFAK
ncbi:MAG: quinone-dependent dihydroorotate dehydrogenase [Gammaproteobacteria bacterium]